MNERLISTISVIYGQACLPKYKEAVALGLESLKFFVSRTPVHMPTQIPQDIYNSRPLPFIIGEPCSHSTAKPKAHGRPNWSGSDPALLRMCVLFLSTSRLRGLFGER
jgi:hypothetical protein